MVGEVDGECGGFAGLPGIFGKAGEMQKDRAFGGDAGVDGGVE